MIITMKGKHAIMHNSKTNTNVYISNNISNNNKAKLIK